ncbi:MAG: pilus assembly PilX N-terminal domain-containing protein [Planctomycetaceae bacterium]|nr:pilus assembly PilX N-terminal domain-containing protein [Planctomycetaceae bacterium]
MIRHVQSPDRRLRISKAKPRPFTHRRGAAMIVAVVCLTLLSAITISLVRLSLASQQQVERDQWRLQSAWLAESGLLRAVAHVEVGQPVESEHWTPTGIGPMAHAGRVTTTVTPDPDNEARLIVTVTADFPDHPTDRVRTTRVRTIIRTNDGNAPAEENE